MENQFASPVPIPSFATGSQLCRKIDYALTPVYATLLYATLVWAVLLAPPVPKHPEHEADCKTNGNEPKCLRMNFNCHGGNSSFCPPAGGIHRWPAKRASCIQMTPICVKNE